MKRPFSPSPAGALVLFLTSSLTACIPLFSALDVARSDASKNSFPALMVLLGADGVASASSCRNDLLKNATGQAGSMAYWTVDQETGAGWISSSQPAIGPFFATDYTFGIKHQEVDLVAAGLDSTYLDSSPTIAVGEKFLTPGFGGYMYLYIELRDQSHSMLASYNFGLSHASLPPNGLWGNSMSGFGSTHTSTTVTYQFTGYPSGVRYILWQDGGSDDVGWAGYFGPYLSSAYLVVANGCTIPY